MSFKHFRSRISIFSFLPFFFSFLLSSTPSLTSECISSIRNRYCHLPKQEAKQKKEKEKRKTNNTTKSSKTTNTHFFSSCACFFFLFLPSITAPGKAHIPTKR
ncbi:hypothetical protein, unlikely [Trypanosoma brucei gambiense DAL972]|uniref:T. brucei spp.-specific protein n=1 Tax=Trypanosoma brucei gambiense (strain MHOM/CI/86/DAL972) TaxID=679716 RepID=D0A3Z7_TRYB9|nr:hypothetical protein, unlikely [Trypanosoma brucei gambiense DAL972]CBH15991.1 hypothetical protein, unlikely [Trypanosoma brucei gambiense DAL972]|eukprot:XP_011778255.1 hypothetical protein, unlikely [Trypanosoma brucei gambiense DAL972]